MPTSINEHLDQIDMATRALEFADPASDEIEDADAVLPSPPRKPHQATPAENPVRDSTEHAEIPAEVGHLIRRSPTSAPPRRFILLQHWEGVVSELTEDSVWADIIDLTTPSNPLEVVEIPLAEIPEPDWPLLTPGSVFYWSIGYEDTPSGTRRRVSEIRARRTPQWSRRMIDALKARGQEVFRQFNENGDHETTGLR